MPLKKIPQIENIPKFIEKIFSHILESNVSDKQIFHDFFCLHFNRIFENANIFFTQSKETIYSERFNEFQMNVSLDETLPDFGVSSSIYSITIFFWPSKKEKEFGAYKTVKTNCYRIKLIYDKKIELVKSERCILLSKKSPLFCKIPHNSDLSTSQNQDTFLNFVCPSLDGWKPLDKLSQKPEKAITKTFIAPWFGKPISSDKTIVQNYLDYLLFDLTWNAYRLILRDKFPYDLKMSNVVFKILLPAPRFLQIDWATPAITPAYFPNFEANRSVLSFNRESLEHWHEKMLIKIKKEPWTVFSSNMIFLIFEIYDWDSKTTAQYFGKMLTDLCTCKYENLCTQHRIKLPKAFLSDFIPKVQSFIEDSQNSQIWQRADFVSRKKDFPPQEKELTHSKLRQELHIEQTQIQETYKFPYICLHSLHTNSSQLQAPMPKTATARRTPQGVRDTESSVLVLNHSSHHSSHHHSNLSDLSSSILLI